MKLPPALRIYWDTQAAREKTLLRSVAVLVTAALLWWIALAPPLRTLRAADAQHRSLDAQVQHMRSLLAQAQALQSQPKLGYDEALRALQACVQQQLGSAAQLSVMGERATLRLQGVPAEALAQWLVQARLHAHALPTDVRLTRAGAGWDGTLVLSLPAR